MKKTLTLGILLVGCCLAALAQTGSTPNQTPPSSTPSTFPQDQTSQTPSNPTTPADPSAIPPDTSASGQSGTNSQASNSQATTVQSCLSQSPEGNFLLADNSGNNIRLRGDTSQLTSYIGKEVQVEGTAVSSSASGGAMSSPTSSDSTSSGSLAQTATQFSVSKVTKLAETCPTSGMKK